MRRWKKVGGYKRFSFLLFVFGWEDEKVERWKTYLFGWEENWEDEK